jgi:hypothetical protein
LNGRSLRQVLEFICLLSCIEFAKGMDSPMVSLLNMEKVRLLADATVKSKAAWYNERPIVPARDLPLLLNAANSALYDQRLEKEVISGGERQEMLYRLAIFFSRQAYIQIRPQKSPLMRIGRLIALSEQLPEWTSALPFARFSERLRGEIRAFPRRAREALGIGVRDVMRIHELVIEYFMRVGTLVWSKLPVASPRESINGKIRLLLHAAAAFHSQLDNFRLSRQNIELIADKVAGEQLGAYASIFGRPINVHRGLLSQPAYGIGPEALRLSPLDRFPLVMDEDCSCWHVPNVRGLACSAPEVVHFALNEGCRETYEDVRGALLEVYLEHMLNARAPHLVVITEEKWKSKKGESAGPDLIVIDHSEEDPILIAGEVKFSYMRPSTRYELLDEDLVSNYPKLWADLKKLPAKVERVLSLAGGYERHRADLLRARNYRRVFLGIVGEAPFLFGELAEYRRKHDPNFPLYGVEPGSSLGVMAVDTFERMIEVVVQRDQRLAAVVREYLAECANLELSGMMAEDFKQVAIDEGKSFAASFVPKVGMLGR